MILIKRLTCCFLSIFFSSCREFVTSDFPDFEPAPVVHCILSEGEPLKLRLSWAAKLDTNRLKFIENAQVRLFVNGEYAETLTHLRKGLYAASCTVASSVRYQCEINIPGRETIIASDSLPAALAPERVQYIPVAGRDEEGQPYPAIRFTFPNNPNERRYYEAMIWEIHTYYDKDSEREHWEWMSQFPSPIIITENNEIINPETGEIIGIWAPPMPTAIYVNQEVYPGPVTDPILKSEGLPVFVFSNELIKGNEYTMTLNFTNGSFSSSGDGEWVADTHPTILELRSISYDYYRYAKQRYLYESTFEPEFGKSNPRFSLYSNIDKGYGIFAGYVATFSDTLNLNGNPKHCRPWYSEE
jgi:hypothetical protein